MAQPKGKYTIWIESASQGTQMHNVSSYKWEDMQATTYFHFVTTDGKEVWMNDFTIRNVVVVTNA